MCLRQIALVARDLDPATEELTDQLGLGEPFADPGVGEFGLHNAVFPIGDTYLEVVSPKQEDTAAGRLLERRGGDGGYMVIFQTRDLESARKQVEALGIRVVWEVSLPDAATIHLHPRDVGAAIVSVDAMDPPESWRWAGPGWEERSRTEVVKRISGVELQAADPAALAERWSQLLGEPAEWDGEASYTITLSEDGAKLRFVQGTDGRGDAVAGVLVEAADPEAAGRSVTLCGTRFVFV